MTRPFAILAGAIVCLSISTSLYAQNVSDIEITGAHELTREAVVDAARVATGQPLPVTPERIADLAERVASHYRDEGYTFASVNATFDEASGVLAFIIDEGVIDAVEFTGVDDRLKHRFADEFALQAGDVFNRSRARQALDVLLRPTRGAVTPGRIFERGGAFSVDLPVTTGSEESRGTFDLVERNGQHLLLVGLNERAGRFKIVPDLGDREDWFTSVDGFVPSLGFGAAVFDHERFNHAYVAGHISYKTASQHVGWAIGFERPFLEAQKLYVGGELHDLTASDDQWQLSSLEASLAAIGPRLSFRDYYERRGVQVTSAYRVDPRLELLAAFRSEEHESLPVESDFSFWNGDEPFRANVPAQDGRMNSLVVGASLDAVGFETESLDATYRRHQLDTLFGETLDFPRRRGDFSAVWRVDWTSEISTPGVLDSDFDFSRHIVSARYLKPLSPHQDFGARFIGGWSGGTLPPQRLFAIGGYGSVHGYEFKEAVGDSMALVNLEYALGWRGGLKVLGFYDAGWVPDRSWLKGIGWGIGLSDFRVEFGYRIGDVPDSLQVQVRFGRSF